MESFSVSSPTLPAGARAGVFRVSRRAAHSGYWWRLGSSWLCLLCCVSALAACGSADEDLFGNSPSNARSPFPSETDGSLEDPGGDSSESDAPSSSDDIDASDSPEDSSNEQPMIDNGVADSVDVDNGSDGSSSGDGGSDDGSSNDSEQPDVNREEVEPEPSPRVISVSPESGASGVFAETPIVITFDTSMSRAQTEAAYQSEGIPSSSVSFSWNDASTELTITPNNPLEYDSGTDPELVQARAFQFFISSSAADTEGNPLVVPFESSFSLLRRIEGSLSAVQDRDLTGSFRSNDTYGEGQCARDEFTVCVGDSARGDDVAYRGFVSFELIEFPSDMAMLSEAELSFQITATNGDPFDLGGLLVERASFEAISLDAFNAEPLGPVGIVTDDADEGDMVSVDVREALAADAGSRTMAQFRLSFEVFNDEEEDFDAVVSAWDTHSLRYAYLIP